MKTKALYVIVFVLAITIILTLIYTRSKVLELNLPQAEVGQSEVITQSVEPVFFHKEAITIIKPAQGKQAIISELDKTEDIKDQQDLGLSSESTSVAKGEANSQDAEETAGVTRLGKYPTNEEMKEMNSQGIVMY
jgi:hypothetical protein